MNNFECDNHRGFHDCDDFTVFKIYAHAAKFPSSGAGVSLINIAFTLYIISCVCLGVYH